MSARPGAAFCLLFAAILSSQAGSPQPARVYLFIRGGSPPAPEFSALKNELASLMGEAKVSIEWGDAYKPNMVDGYLVVVDLQGDCTVRSRAEARPGLDSAPLGWSAVADGRILPFISVDCAALSALLTSRIAAIPADLRSWLYGRAIARVLAHELYHYFGHATDHSRAGVARARFSASDMLQERFEFDGQALSRLRDSQSVTNEVTDTSHFANLSTTAQ